MPAAPGATPRKMLPPPMTTAICTPSRTTSAISATMRSIVSRLMPYASSPVSASPDSLSKMRRYAGCAATVGTAASGAATVGALFGGLMTYSRLFDVERSLFKEDARVYTKPSGARHRRHLGGKIILSLFDALADDKQHEAVDLCALRFDKIAYCLLTVAFDERLREKRHLGDILGDRTLDHFLDDVRGLARFGRTRRCDRTFFGDDIRRHVFLADGHRFACGDMQSEVFAERVGAAGNVDDDPD